MNQQTPSNIYLAHCKQDLIDTIMLDYEVLNEIYPIVAKNDLTPIYTPKKDKPFYIAGFTSNSGAIIDKAIELQKHIKSIRGESPYEFVFLFSDNKNPKGANIFFKEYDLEEIAQNNKIPLTVNDIDDYYKTLGYDGKKDARLSFDKKMSIRKSYDAQVVQKINSLETPVDSIVLDYYWSLCSSLITDNYLTMNSHLGDLSVVNEKNERLLRGFYPVRKAIKQGHKKLYSTTHMVDDKVDNGSLMLRSKPLEISLLEDLKFVSEEEDPAKAIESLNNPVILNLLEDLYESEMREWCDSHILPLTLLLVSEGRFAKDKQGAMYFNGHQINSSIKL